MPNVKTVGLFEVDTRLWYISDTVIIASDPAGRIFAYPTVDDPTQDDWQKVFKVIKKIQMEPIGGRKIINSKECLEVRET